MSDADVTATSGNGYNDYVSSYVEKDEFIHTKNGIHIDSSQDVTDLSLPSSNPNSISGVVTYFTLIM